MRSIPGPRGAISGEGPTPSRWRRWSACWTDNGKPPGNTGQETDGAHARGWSPASAGAGMALAEALDGVNGRIWR